MALGEQRWCRGWGNAFMRGVGGEDRSRWPIERLRIRRWDGAVEGWIRSGRMLSSVSPTNMGRSFASIGTTTSSALAEWDASIRFSTTMVRIGAPGFWRSVKSLKEMRSGTSSSCGSELPGFISPELTRGSRSSPTLNSQVNLIVKLYSCSDPFLDLRAAVNNASLDASVLVTLCRE